MAVNIEVGLTPFDELNRRIHAEIAAGKTQFILSEVYGQRYIGDALEAPVDITIKGTPGNDMAAFMDGARIEVFGNGQDQVANTMNAGEVIIHGRCGDTAGYGMRGGSVFVKGDAGWRCGIHMKQYQDHCPKLVIGGNAGAFLGEYMAGGIILLLGCPERYLANGMHGGVIYVGHPVDEIMFNDQVVQEPLDDFDRQQIEPLLKQFNEYFDAKRVITDEFRRIRPKSSRPYGSMYTD